MIIYEWLIEDLSVYKEYQNQNDVVYQIHWRLVGSEVGYSSSVYGTTDINISSLSTFIPYENLTKSVVIEWLEQALGTETIDKIRATIEFNIESQKNPTTDTLFPPWQ